jgi:hypothetical protein
MKALISSIEPREAGYRVAQVVTNNATFPVAEPDLFWVDCEDNVVADLFWYNPSDQQIKPISQPPEGS